MLFFFSSSHCHAGPGSRKTTPGGQEQPFQRDDDDENLSAAQVPDHETTRAAFFRVPLRPLDPRARNVPLTSASLFFGRIGLGRTQSRPRRDPRVEPSGGDFFCIFWTKIILVSRNTERETHLAASSLAEVRTDQGRPPAPYSRRAERRLHERTRSARGSRHGQARTCPRLETTRDVRRTHRTRIRRPGLLSAPRVTTGSRCEWPAVLTLVDDDDGGRVRRHLRGSRAGGARDT